MILIDAVLHRAQSRRRHARADGRIRRHRQGRWRSARGLISVDLQAGWETLLAHVHSTAIAWDRVHPNQVGCMHIARQFLQAVGFDR